MSNYSWGLMLVMAALSLPVILDLADCIANAITTIASSIGLQRRFLEDCDEPLSRVIASPATLISGPKKRKEKSKERKENLARTGEGLQCDRTCRRSSHWEFRWVGGFFFPGRGSAQRVEKGEELTEPCWTVMRTASVRYVCSTSNRTMNSTIAWDRNTHVRGSHLIELSGRRRLDSIPLPRTPLQSLPPCGRKDTANAPH